MAHSSGLASSLFFFLWKKDDVTLPEVEWSNSWTYKLQKESVSCKYMINKLYKQNNNIYSKTMFCFVFEVF